MGFAIITNTKKPLILFLFSFYFWVFGSSLSMAGSKKVSDVLSELPQKPLTSKETQALVEEFCGADLQKQMDLVTQKPEVCDGFVTRQLKRWGVLSRIGLEGRNAQGNSLLIEATKAGNLAVVKALIDKKVDLESKNKEGLTALQVALLSIETATSDKNREKYDLVVAELIKAGAKFDKALDRNNGTKKYKQLPWFFVIEKGCIHSLKAMYNAQLGPKGSELSSYEARKKSKPMFKKKDAFGRTSLQVAFKNKQFSTCQFIIPRDQTFFVGDLSKNEIEWLMEAARESLHSKKGSDEERDETARFIFDRFIDSDGIYPGLNRAYLDQNIRAVLNEGVRQGNSNLVNAVVKNRIRGPISKSLLVEIKETLIDSMSRSLGETYEKFQKYWRVYSSILRDEEKQVNGFDTASHGQAGKDEYVMKNIGNALQNWNNNLNPNRSEVFSVDSEYEKYSIQYDLNIKRRDDKGAQQSAKIRDLFLRNAIENAGDDRIADFLSGRLIGISERSIEDPEFDKELVSYLNKKNHLDLIVSALKISPAARHYVQQKLSSKGPEVEELKNILAERANFLFTGYGIPHPESEIALGYVLMEAQKEGKLDELIRQGLTEVDAQHPDLAHKYLWKLQKYIELGINIDIPAKGTGGKTIKEELRSRFAADEGLKQDLEQRLSPRR